MEKLKKIIAAILSVVMVFSLSSAITTNVANTTTNTTTTKLKIGDYVKFGHYYGDAILWRVININDDGSEMLYSEKILCIKPFDVAESGKYDKKGGHYTTQQFRQMNGSNRWSNRLDMGIL